jgi:hypothetical protein
LRQQRSLDSIARAVAGMKRFDHRALLAKQSTRGGSGDAEGRPDLIRLEP